MPNPFDESVRSVVPNDEESERFSSFRMVHSRSSAFVNTGDGRHPRQTGYGRADICHGAPPAGPAARARREPEIVTLVYAFDARPTQGANFFAGAVSRSLGLPRQIISKYRSSSQFVTLARNWRSSQRRVAAK